MKHEELRFGDVTPWIATYHSFGRTKVFKENKLWVKFVYNGFGWTLKFHSGRWFLDFSFINSIKFWKKGEYDPKLWSQTSGIMIRFSTSKNLRYLIKLQRNICYVDFGLSFLNFEILGFKIVSFCSKVHLIQIITVSSCSFHYVDRKLAEDIKWTQKMNEWPAKMN